jgi:16S rRNA (adenine1518-N6/adenine1519-N6)-dimethyltransferase
MNIFKPSALQAFLKERGLHAKKRLSQNFLIDGNIIQKIISTAAISKGDQVIEIGPGPGALTEALLERGASVTAIEMDPLFAKELHRLQTPKKHLEVICCDFLTFPLEDFFQKHVGKFKVVANLPYHITTPILTRLLPLYPFIESLTIMVQKEFADRMIAEKKTPSYSSFTLFFQFYATAAKWFVVSPTCFYPRPKIHSTVVHCALHPPLLKTDTPAFFQLTRAAFGKRRKMLRASLKEQYPVEKIEQALINLGCPATARPEELSLQEFISLFELLSNRKYHKE